MLWLDLSRCKVFEDRLIITEGLSSSTTISAGTLRPLRQLSAYRPSLFLNQTTDYSAELEAREEILARIMDLAKQLGSILPFPTRTLVIEAPPRRICRWREEPSAPSSVAAD
jgi:hypothetical protein